jgi:hypothetical protein
MMDRSLIIDWGGVEYPNQKPPGYGECNPLVSVFVCFILTSSLQVAIYL